MKKALLSKLDEISRAISAEVQGVPNIGVLDGLSGNILFEFYYARFLNSDPHADFGASLITKCLRIINEGSPISTYCGGIAGMGWTLDHLRQKGFIELDCDLILPELDPFLYYRMCEDMKAGHFDFLHGAMGYCFYFLKRYTNTDSDELKQKYKQYILNFVDLLDKISEKEKDKGTIRWSAQYDPTKNKVFSFGLAHGITSIVNFLGRLHDFDDFHEKTKDLLHGGVNYLLSRIDIDKRDAYCVFPSWESLDGTLTKYSRLGWCYGDLGVGITLWNVSKVLKEQSLESVALQTLHHATRRRSKDQTQVIDAGICHGAFGIAHIFGQTYWQTRKKEFREASLFWMQEGLKMAIHVDGFAGYQQYEGITGGWKPRLNLLGGIAGIGLVIIDHLSGTNSEWDECLMIS